MPTEPPSPLLRLTTHLPRLTPGAAAPLALSSLTLTIAMAMATAAPAMAQTSTPYYLGASLGLTHVSTNYRQSTGANSDRVLSAGLLAGIDQSFGRQRLSADGSVQDNRYSDNRSLNNRSYNLRTALDWQTVGRLSGTVSASTSRSLADFNIGNGAIPSFSKNAERNEEYGAVARLGVGTRYSLESGFSHRRRNFSAAEYQRFVYQQNTTSIGAYATPGANLKLGVAARRTRGTNPNSPIFALGFPFGSAPNDFTRNDFDLTASWNTGGSSNLNARVSASSTHNSLANIPFASGFSSGIRDFKGTTGALGWNWQVSPKLLLGTQFSRDTGQEALPQATEINSVYNRWRFSANYELTAKVSLNAAFNTSRSHASSNSSFDNDNGRALGIRWAFSRGVSLGCQINHSGRDSSSPANIYSADSYGCTGQALVF